MKRTTLIFCFAAFFAVLMSCAGENAEGDADALEDAAPGDADVLENMDGGEELDAQPEDIPPEELPPAFEGYCRACTYNIDCLPGGACIALDEGELDCSIPCELPTDCPSDSTCENVPESDSRQCKPVSGTCVWDRIGDPCRSWGCSGRNDLCSDPEGADGYCTHWCASRVDCEAGYMQCLDRGDGTKVCLKDPLPPPVRCGTVEHGSGVGSPCGSGTCSDPVFLCADTLGPSMPPICTHSCTVAADCSPGEGAVCAVLPGAPPGERYCLPDECRCLDVRPGSLFDGLLEEGGLDRCSLTWDTELMTRYFGGSTVTHDRFRIPWTDDVHNEWLRSIPVTADVESRLDGCAALGIGQFIAAAANLAGHPIVGGENLTTPADDQPLAAAVAALMTSLGEIPDQPAYELDAADVPADVQEFAARIILAVADAVRARNDALALLEGDRWDINRYYERTARFILYSFSPGLEVTDRKVQDFLIGDFDYELLYQASYDIAHNAELFASSVLPHPSSERFSFNQPTPAGRILISDGSDTAYGGAMATADYLFVLDVGGNDTYEISAGGTSSVDNPVSVLIDLGGADTYAYPEVPDPNDGSRLASDGSGRAAPTADYGPFSLSEVPRQGSGKLGIGMLMDLGSQDDRYRSLRISQGSGVLGVGLLFDDGGSDVYECEAACQGSGMFGLGILVDAGSAGATPGDTFNSYHASQGFAFTGGAGILYNTGGDDAYFCNEDDVLYPSPQDAVSNASMCQGMGFGRRADAAVGGDGVNMSGGIGILRDLQGNDSYRAAIFGQGSGYWFGFGFLLDGEGSDRYDGRWYVQGSTAHFATSVLHDAGGEDFYDQSESRLLNIILGGGHDFSNSFLIDDSGNDHYFSPNLSLGTGNDNGFGLFVDHDGDDEMQCAGDTSFGNAGITPSAGREAFPSVGIFLQCGGTDTYTRPDTTLLGNDTTWRQKVHPASDSEIGLGGDSAAQECGI